jgi:hypothetical protein
VSRNGTATTAVQNREPLPSAEGRDLKGAQVDQRVGSAPEVSDGSGHQDERGDAEPDHRPPGELALGQQVGGVGEAAQPGAGEHHPEEIQGRRGVVAAGLDQPRGHHQGHRAQRHVDEKQPTPAGVGGDQTAGERRDHRRHQRRPYQQRHHPQHVCLGGAREDDETADRDHHRAARALQHAEHHQLGEGAAQRARQRRRREQEDRGQEHRPGAPARGQPAAERDEHRQGDQIGGDHQADGGGGHVQGAPDARRGRGDDGPVEVLHEEATRDQKGDAALARLDH